MGHTPSKYFSWLLFQRGFRDREGADQFLNPKLKALKDPSGMLDRDKAATRVAKAIAGKECIAIFGDYDVDGATSACILAEVIEALGGTVHVFSALRFDGGYGLSEPAIHRIKKVKPNVLITCDCGSSDHERIRMANGFGMDVIVLDHHLVPKETLPSYAFINPHRPECPFPYKGMASAGLAFLLAAAIRTELRVELDLKPWLDLVAIGTIADVAPLTEDNRVLVRAGLLRLQRETLRPGLEMMFQKAKIVRGAFGAYDVAFRIAPRLNAAGRMDDPKYAMAVLRAKSRAEAKEAVDALEKLNDLRKTAQEKISAEAETMVMERWFSDPKGGAPQEAALGGIWIGKRGWHPGVVGIVASRLVDKFKVPTVVLGFDDQGVGHGSGRTPPGFPLHDEVSKLKEHLIKFGGHNVAIGITMHESKLDMIQEAFSEQCKVFKRESNPPAPSEPKHLLVDERDVPSFDEMLMLEPLGESNRATGIVIKNVKVLERSQIQNKHLSLKLQLGRLTIRAFGFGMAQDAPDTIQTITGSFRTDGYRNQVEIALDSVS